MYAYVIVKQEPGEVTFSKNTTLLTICFSEREAKLFCKQLKETLTKEEKYYIYFEYIKIPILEEDILENN